MAGCGRGCVIAHPASHTVCSPKVNLTMRRRRIHSAIGYITPQQAEAKYA
jgi:hypothetical protein